MGDVEVKLPDDGVPRTDRRRAVVGASVVALVFVAAGVAIYRQRHSLADSISHIGVGPMVGSLALALVGTALAFRAWYSVLRGLGVDLPRRVADRVFFTSQLGKYLPGSVWPVVLQMEAGRARGASRRTMISGNLITLILSCAVGLVLAALLLPLSDATALHRYWYFLLLLPVLIGLLHPRAIPWLLDALFGLLKREPLGERLDARASATAAVWAALYFVLVGLHVGVLAIAFGASTGTMMLLSVGGMALAVSGGVLFIPAPAGAGIRDVILALVLGSQLTNAQALAVVIASRVILIVADLGLAAGVLVLRRFRPPADAGSAVGQAIA